MRSFITFLICFFLFIIIVGRCANKNRQEEANTTEKYEAEPVREEPYIKETQSFIKNTIYHTEDYEVVPMTDYRYTPTKTSYVGPIEVEIINQKATIHIDNTFFSVHKIISERCFEYNDEKVAVLETDKGEIQIFIHQSGHNPHVRFIITSDNYKIGLGNGVSELIKSQK